MTTTAPTPATALAYLGGPTVTRTIETVTPVLAAEAAAQSNVCRVPAAGVAWPEDLAEALHRRVARNLALRGLPLGLSTTVTEVGAAVVRVGTDPEIRRLEAPHRRLVLG